MSKEDIIEWSGVEWSGKQYKLLTDSEQPRLGDLYLSIVTHSDTRNNYGYNPSHTYSGQQLRVVYREAPPPAPTDAYLDTIECMPGKCDELVNLLKWARYAKDQ